MCEVLKGHEDSGNNSDWEVWKGAWQQVKPELCLGKQGRWQKFWTVFIQNTSDPKHVLLFFPHTNPFSDSLTSVSCPTMQFNSDDICTEVESEPTSSALSPTRPSSLQVQIKRYGSFITILVVFLSTEDSFWHSCCAALLSSSPPTNT